MMHRATALSVFALAWVLWSKSVPLGGTTDPQKETWELVEGMSQETDCRARAAELERRERLNLTARISFHCFPDTVDPRPRR